uniref:Transposon protein putative n=1 Tax=Albugo laibachii Nc14 TaxID=890382 RepID=F0W3T9_9STRA|nr:transposon protein putative [Albugo laibachii Nc14]|eukprot:CCA15687.1 transposon protein putative [Albugo laibachii Nc14]
MTRGGHVRMLKEKVFPAIRKLLPGGRSSAIKVQQYNPGEHVLQNDADILDAGIKERWNIVMQGRPPRFPDMNLLELGLFNALHSVQYQTDSHTTGALTVAVNRDFERIQTDTIDKEFLTLQKVMEKVIENEGGNNFQLSRVKKIHFSRGPPPRRCRSLLILFVKGSLPWK